MLGKAAAGLMTYCLCSNGNDSLNQLPETVLGALAIYPNISDGLCKLLECLGSQCPPVVGVALAQACFCGLTVQWGVLGCFARPL